MKERIDNVLWFPASADSFCLDAYETRKEALDHIPGDAGYTYAAKARVKEIPRKKKGKK